MSRILLLLLVSWTIERIRDVPGLGQPVKPPASVPGSPDKLLGSLLLYSASTAEKKDTRIMTASAAMAMI